MSHSMLLEAKRTTWSFVLGLTFTSIFGLVLLSACRQTWGACDRHLIHCMSVNENHQFLMNMPRHWAMFHMFYCASAGQVWKSGNSWQMTYGWCWWLEMQRCFASVDFDNDHQLSYVAAVCLTTWLATFCESCLLLELMMRGYLNVTLAQGMGRMELEWNLTPWASWGMDTFWSLDTGWVDLTDFQRNSRYFWGCLNLDAGNG